MEIPLIISGVLGVLTLLALVVLFFLKKSPQPELASILTLLTYVCIMYFFLFQRSSKQSTNSGDSVPNPNSAPQTKHSHPPVKSKRKYQPVKKKNILEPHPLLAANFKGHTDKVFGLSFSPDGKYLSSISKGIYIVIIVDYYMYIYIYTLCVRWYTTCVDHEVSE